MRKDKQMDEERLKRIGAELVKARAKRGEWDTKVKALERRYREAENACIHEMVHAANMTPEQLGVLIRKAKAGRLFTGPAEKAEEYEKEVPQNE